MLTSPHAVQVLHEASTEHVVSLLSAFAQLSGRAGSVSSVVDDFLARLTAELHMRVFDGPVCAAEVGTCMPECAASLVNAAWRSCMNHCPHAEVSVSCVCPVLCSRCCT